VVYICGCIPARIQHALAELPETLDETYQRTLQEINKADWEFAYRLFQFVAVASRPLRVEELAELLAFDFKAGPIPRFYEDWRLEDPVDAVLSTCSSLLAIVDGGYQDLFGKVIQFSHFSVKEYLTSTRISKASDIILRRYYVPMTPAHTLAAQACLGVLLHLDKDVVTRDNLQKFPLAEYAAKYWAYHALFEGVSQSVEDGLKRLFDPRKPHLAVCVWIYDPRKQTRRAERPLPPLGTSLHYAALWGIHLIVEFLAIECSQNVRSRGFADKVTPLHLASKWGHVKTARKIIEIGADVEAQSKDGETPLHLASRNGGVEVVRMLIERGADVATRNKDGETPLHRASRYREVEVVHMHIERGADMAVQDKYGETPLHLASRNGEVGVVRMLIARGADVTARNKGGETPLHLALESEQVEVEVVRILIESGVGVAAQNKYGETPLHLASRYGKVEVIRILIEHGAEVVTQNKAGETPLHLASRYGTLQVALMLMERGADVEAHNKNGETPLHLALLLDRVEVTRVLIECGADVEAQNKAGETPLHLASRYGKVEVALMLIERGADVAAHNKKGETPLHLASRPNLYSFQLEGLAEVSRILLEQGADVNAKNNAGITPLRLASQSRHLRDTRAQVLLQHGADPVDGTGEDFSFGIFDSDSDPEMDSDSDQHS
jgi:ankyrin repeat protein